MKKKLQAFTLIEVTIAMIISSIVVSSSMLAYRSVTTTFNYWLSLQTEALDNLQAVNQLEFDIFRTSKLSQLDSVLILNNDSSVTRYSIQGPFLIRNRSDTILYNCKNWSFQRVADTDLLSSIEFEISAKGIPLPVRIDKQHSYHQINQVKNGNPD